MRNIYWTMKGAMLGGIIVALSASPAMAFGENKMVNEKMVNEKAMVEMIKVEKVNKAEKVMLQEKKVAEPMVMIMKPNMALGEILGEGILGEDILGLGE
jgi:hypothetical protein